jgi:tol-pal system protein YbgF
MLRDRRSGSVRQIASAALVALIASGCAHSNDAVDRELKMLRAKFAALERVHVPRYEARPGVQSGRAPTPLVRQTPTRAPTTHAGVQELGFPVRETHPQLAPARVATPRLPVVRVQAIQSDPFANGGEPAIRIGKRGAMAQPAEAASAPSTLEYARLDAYGNLVDQHGKIIYRAGSPDPSDEPGHRGNAFDDPHESPERRIERMMGPPKIEAPRGVEHDPVPKALNPAEFKRLGLGVGDEAPFQVRTTPALGARPKLVVRPLGRKATPKPAEVVERRGDPVESALVASPATRAPGPNRLTKQRSYKGAKQRAAKDLYKQARTKFLAAHYKVASRLFERFLKRYYDHELADNALYWLGETAYVQSNWMQSLSWFQDVIIRYPEGNKLAGAMLKSALCYAQMGDKAYAVKVLTDVETLFPSERIAEIARSRRIALIDGGR